MFIGAWHGRPSSETLHCCALLCARLVAEGLPAAEPDWVPERRPAQDLTQADAHSASERRRPATQPVVLPVRRQASCRRRRAGRGVWSAHGRASRRTHVDRQHRRCVVAAGCTRRHRHHLVHTSHGENLLHRQNDTLWVSRLRCMQMSCRSFTALFLLLGLLA